MIFRPIFGKEGLKLGFLKMVALVACASRSTYMWRVIRKKIKTRAVQNSERVYSSLGEKDEAKEWLKCFSCERELLSNPQIPNFSRSLIWLTNRSEVLVF